MDWNLKITDMAGATPEHSAVIVNFVAAIRHQLKNSTCYVYSDNIVSKTIRATTRLLFLMHL